MKTTTLLLFILFSTHYLLAQDTTHNGTYGQPYTQGLGAYDPDGNLKSHLMTVQVNNGSVQIINTVGHYDGFDVTSTSGVFDNTGTGFDDADTQTMGDWTGDTLDPYNNSVQHGTGALGAYRSLKYITIIPKITGTYLIASTVTDFDDASATSTDTVTVGTQPLTITLSGTKVYDGGNSFAGTQTASLDSTAIAGDAITAIKLPAKNVGAYATATNLHISNVKGDDVTGFYRVNYAGSATVTTATVIVTGLTGIPKTYDRTATATVSGDPVLSGTMFGDDVSLSGTGTFTFADIAAGHQIMNGSGYSLTGNDAFNYTLSEPNLLGEIDRKLLTITNVSVVTRQWDGTNLATVQGGDLQGVISPDDVSLNTANATGIFDDPTVATNKTVTTAGYALTGADAHNYAVVQPTTTGTIIPQWIPHNTVAITDGSVEFGWVEIGKTATMTYQIANTGNCPLDVLDSTLTLNPKTSLYATTTGFQASGIARSMPLNATADGTVTFTATQIEDETTTLSVQTSGDHFQTTLHATTYLPLPSATPSLGDLKGTTTMTPTRQSISFLVQNQITQYVGDLILNSLTIEGPFSANDSDLPKTLKPGESYKITVIPSGTGNGVLHISVNDLNHPEIIIPIVNPSNR